MKRLVYLKMDQIKSETLSTVLVIIATDIDYIKFEDEEFRIQVFFFD